MAKDTVQVLDGLCLERGMRRAELIGLLINEASSLHEEGRNLERAQNLRSQRVES